MSKPNTTGGGGMNPQEAQQAQTIDKSVKQLRGWLKENSVNGLSRGPFYDNIESVLNHVDSQAQKIAASATVIEEMHAHTVTLNALYLQAEEKIAEQAREIEKLKANRNLVPLDSEHGRLRS